MEGSGFIGFRDVIFYRTGLFFLLLTAAYTDWKRGRIYNLQIGVGLGLGVCAAVCRGVIWNGTVPVFDLDLFNRELLFFLVRFMGVCVVFFPLFLWRMMGAGDIKLMAVCVGNLGTSDGVFMVFLGLSLAAVAAARIMCREGQLWIRLEKLAAFMVEIGRGKHQRYQTRYQKADVIHLGPYLFLGYCLYLVIYGG